MIKKSILLIFLLTSSLIVWTGVIDYNNSLGELEIETLDIGQGDSILIKTPKNHYGIIDSGRDSKVINELKDTLPLGTQTIDFAILTHPDADHIGGFLDIFKDYKIRYVFFNKADKTNSVISKIEDEIQTYGINNYSIDMNNDFTFDGVYFNVVWPEDYKQTYNFSNSNDMSVGVLIKYNGFKFLSMGDLPSTYEKTALDNLPAGDRDIDFLKVGHHGSRFSTNADFLAEAKPEYAFISVGTHNTYGHPTQEVLNNLKKANTQIFRTDVDGRIDLIIKNQNVDIITLTTKKNITFSKF